MDITLKEINLLQLEDSELWDKLISLTLQYGWAREDFKNIREKNFRIYTHADLLIAYGNNIPIAWGEI
jgi:hypothetical protein